MDDNIQVASELRPDFAAIAQVVRTSAQSYEGDCLTLLALLRLLESLHREISDSFFQDSLPTNRQALYALLRDIEAEGGWPYIHRMKLQALLVNLPPEDPGEVSSEVVSMTAEPGVESEDYG
ncbi:hypothetical protein [Trichocoleus sp. FACHB-262]|uniref:hypothetical protein n=1 Tax=Trichocoleus sp. FACHB-262 TaxID=2692869 RepID=UPI001689C40C|nr:hypothetical protein [Trichocoleus sp. FACHB-262]MBD2122949.1 hypothetical protein [Trichocoleus sp. FACHB-262]